MKYRISHSGLYVKLFIAVTIASLPNMANRERLIAKLAKDDPKLYTEYQSEKHFIETYQKSVHASARFPLTSYGRLNSAPLFAELARQIVSPKGRIGLIIPTGIATDSFNQYFFQDLIKSRSLVSLFDFENRERTLFPEVYYRMRFCLLTLTGEDRPVGKADFFFFALRIEDLSENEKHFSLSAGDLAVINPNTLTCPIFRSKHDAEITKSIYSRVSPLVNEGDENFGNPWGFRGLLMFMMNTDSHLFKNREDLEGDGWFLRQNTFQKNGQEYLPLYEGRMINLLDHRYASAIQKEVKLKRSGESRQLTNEDKRDPLAFAMPRYWISAIDVDKGLLEDNARGWILGCMSITSATNARTAIAAILPRVGLGNSITAILSTQSAEIQAGLVANFSCFVFDYVCKQKVSGNNFNMFIIKQLPFIQPDIYRQRCPWQIEIPLSTWVLKRVLELSYTSWDLESFSKDCGYNGPPFRWTERRRPLLLSELDAAYFHLYGISRDEVNYIMETFRIVKDNDLAEHGEYHTKQLILKCYDAMQRAKETRESYTTILDPPPADPRVAHLPRKEKG